MLRTNRLLTLFVLATLLISACQPLIDPDRLPNLSSNSPSSQPEVVQPALPLQTSFLFNIQIDLAAPRDIGSIPELGIRYLYDFAGGTVAGPNLHGEVLPAGENWFLIRNNCVSDLYMEGQLRTDDGALISFIGHSYSRTTPEVRQAIFDGAAINPDDYDFRGVPFFETDAAQYAWLNDVITVATYRFAPDKVIISVYAIE
jgi:hypothetical protein